MAVKMDWLNTYNQMLNEANEEEPQTPAEKIDVLDDLLFEVVTALGVLLNGKDDGKQDEQAKDFLQMMDDLSDNRFRAKFPQVVKQAQLLDKREKGNNMVKTKQALVSLVKLMTKAKNEKPEDATQGDSREQ